MNTTAKEKACDLLANESCMTMSNHDFQAFTTALNDAFAPNAALKRLGNGRCQMANVRELSTTFVDWEARILLAALTREASRLRELTETSADEDVAADAGNDLLEVCGLLERLSANAIGVFGDQILSSSS